MPVSVIALPPEPETITPPESTPVRVPAPAAMVSVMSAPPNPSQEKVTADRFTLLAVSSTTVTSVGSPVTRGLSLTALTVIARVSLEAAPLLSVAVMVTVLDAAGSSAVVLKWKVRTTCWTSALVALALKVMVSAVLPVTVP